MAVLVFRKLETMNNDDYSDTPIIKNAWPEWVSGEGGEVVRRWKLAFERDLQEKLHRVLQAVRALGG